MFLSQWQRITKDPVILAIVRGYQIDFHLGNTLAKTCSKNLSCREQYTLDATRDKQTHEKGGYNPRTSHTHGVLQSFISGTKERRLISPSHRLKSLKQIHSERTFSNGKLNVHKAPFNRKRVYGQTRPKGRLSNGGRSSRVTEVPSVRLARPNLSVSSLTVRAKHGTTNIYETTETCDSLSSHSKYQTSRLPGRHSNHRVVSANTKGAHSSGNRPTSKPRLYSQLREVSVDPFSSPRVPRVLDKLKTIKFYLPQTKVAKVLDLCKSLLKENPTSLHLLSQLQGFLQSCRPAVRLAPPALQESTELLNPTSSVEQWVVSGHCSSRPPSSRELQWWITNIKSANGSPIHPPATEMVITSDASKMGWGATHGNFSTNGRWSKQESALHINVLELKATFLAVQAFLKNQSNLAVKLHLDNTTAVTYINNQGGTRSTSLTSLTLQLWKWCLQHNILITAEHLPGVPNVRADRKSRTFIDLSDWKLQPEIIQCFLKNREIDLFATRLTNQLKSYVSWRPDPQAVATDAFSIDWSQLKGYAFPPFNLIPRTLMKVISNNANIVLVAPIWQTQHWWPLLLQLVVQLPVLLPASPTLLQDPSNPKAIHPMYPRLRLAVWTISNNSAQQQAFRQELPVRLSSATRQSTNKSYDYAWTKWNSWCNRRKVNPISATVKDILTFLSDQFDSNLQYRTVNVLRSAISSIHPWIEGKPVGQHPLVTRLMKGIANERLPKPRYTTTWDVAKVTTHLSALGENKTLSLRLLTKKILMLLALVSPERSSVLWELNIRYLKNNRTVWCLH